MRSFGSHSQYFIAGHRGLVGSAICRVFTTKLGAERVLTRTRESLDLSCENAVESFLIDNSSLEAVIVCSAKVGGIAANTTDQVGFLLENLRIQNSIFRGVLNSDIEKLLFLGSSCIYPKMASQPIIEEYLLTGPLENTNEGYAIAKIAGLKLCKYVSAEVNGKDFRAVMPTNVYGSNDNFDPVSGHVIGAMISKFVEAKEKDKETVSLFGTGKALREFIHADDLANACYEVMSLTRSEYDAIAPEGFLNIGTGVEVSIQDLAYMIRSIVGYDGGIRFDNSRPDGTPRKLLDSSKIRTLNWQPSVTLQDGIAEAVKSYEKYRGSSA